MRTLEVLVLIALAPLIVAILFPVRRVSWLRILAWTALALALLQIIIEGYRWQMIPAYLLVIAACLRAQRPRGTEARDSLWRRAVRLAFGVVGIVAWTAVLLLGSGMPVFRAPTPAGPYSVGTAQLYFRTLRARIRSPPIREHRANCSWWPGIPRNELQASSRSLFGPMHPSPDPCWLDSCTCLDSVYWAICGWSDRIPIHAPK